MRHCLRILIIAAASIPIGANLALAQAAGNQPDTSCQFGPPPAATAGYPTSGLALPGLHAAAESAPVCSLYDQLTVLDGVYTLTGHVLLNDGMLWLAADRIVYDAKSGEANADGHVAFDDPAEATHVEGPRAQLNWKTSSGEFDDFQGVSGIQVGGRQNTIVSKNPLVFSGTRLLRLSPEHYVIEHGRVTSCTMPDPKWLFSARRAEVVIGADAKLYDTTFYLLRIPVFYFPYLPHSTENTGRHSGLLLPMLGDSNSKGKIVGDSFYWDAARNVNLTLGGEYLSSRGWGDLLDLESLPTRDSSLDLHVDGVFDRGLPEPDGGREVQGGQEVHADGEFDPANGFRAVLDADYVSSYVYRLAFQSSFAAAINSEAISTAFVEKALDGYDFSLMAHRYQDFLGTTPTASLSLASLPSLEAASQPRPLLSGNFPLYFAFDASAALLDRAQPGFQTGAMPRLDFEPTFLLPLATPFGNFTFSASDNSTYYGDQQVASAPGAVTPALEQLVRNGLWRQAYTGGMDWRLPTLERVYDTGFGLLGKRIKHVIEPEIGWQETHGVDSTDQIIRFDDRDILSDTDEVDYGITNRLLSSNGDGGPSRELISWTVMQKYFLDPTFGGALVPGANNVFLTNALLSPFDFEAQPNRFSPLTSLVRVSPFKRFDGDWRLDFNARTGGLVASALSADFHFTDRLFFDGSHYVLRATPGAAPSTLLNHFDQLRLSGGYGDFSQPGFGAAAAAAYDVQTSQLQYVTVQTTYNWDCAGFSVEFRRFELATVRREDQISASLTLSNIGTFGNLKRASRLF